MNKPGKEISAGMSHAGAEAERNIRNAILLRMKKRPGSRLPVCARPEAHNKLSSAYPFLKSGKYNCSPQRRREHREFDYIFPRRGRKYINLRFGIVQTVILFFGLSQENRNIVASAISAALR
jgi:hypothetical protein